MYSCINSPLELDELLTDMMWYARNGSPFNDMVSVVMAGIEDARQDELDEDEIAELDEDEREEYEE
jgi:hypothetical protein